MAVRSAGIILYWYRDGRAQVLLVHPGGPYWRRKDQGAWMIPKGMVEEGEDALDAALREFEEEVGTRLDGRPRLLCRIRQSGGKWVDAFALEGDLDASAITSISFEMEWPPRSGMTRHYPEVDDARWFEMADARRMMLASQRPILDALEADLAS